MSRFIFGAIYIENDSSDKLDEDFAWEVAKYGIENRIYVLMPFIIFHKDLKEMLKEHIDERQRNVLLQMESDILRTKKREKIMHYLKRLLSFSGI
jgi:hypothetical protein